MLFLQKKLRSEYQLLTLALVDTGERATPLCVFSVADFDEYYCIAVKHDQIKLAAFARPVLRDERQTVLLQVSQGVGFSLAPCGLFRVACVQGAVSGRRWTLPSTNSAQGNWRSMR